MTMKKQFIYLLVAVSLTTACTKNIDPFMPNPDERLIKILGDYEDTLVAAPNGWKAYLYPGAGGGYSFYMTFDHKNNVTMLSDIDTVTGLTPKTSTYRLKALQQPSLLFDTYNYLHILTDPDETKNGGARGTGLSSDLEFAYLVTGTQGFAMIGLANQCPFYLVKASADEAAKFNAGGLKQMIKNNDAFLKNNKYTYLQFTDGKKIQVSISKKVISLTYVEGSKVITTSSSFLFTLKGIQTRDSLKYANNSFSELLWDAALQSYYVVVNGVRTNVLPSVSPIVPFYLQYGKDKDYSLITVNTATLTGLSADFLSVYATAKAGLAAVGNNAGRVLDYFSIAFTGEEEMTLRVYYHNTANSNFTATFLYKITRPATETVRFTFVSRDNNANTAGPGIVALTNYLEQNELKLDWFPNLTPGSTALLGGFTKATNANSYFFGPVAK
jgi:hypothetical protein